MTFYALTLFVQMHGEVVFPPVLFAQLENINYLCFQAVQIKQVDCKMSTKNVNNYK